MGRQVVWLAGLLLWWQPKRTVGLGYFVVLFSPFGVERLVVEGMMFVAVGSGFVEQQVVLEWQGLAKLVPLA